MFSYLEKRKGILDGVCITGGEPLLQEDLAEELFPEARKIYVGASFGENALPDAAAAACVLEKILQKGDLLFAKGSSGVALEKILPPVDEVL